jgi:hypothetical protein
MAEMLALLETHLQDRNSLSARRFRPVGQPLEHCPKRRITMMLLRPDDERLGESRAAGRLRELAGPTSVRVADNYRPML